MWLTLRIRGWKSDQLRWNFHHKARQPHRNDPGWLCRWILQGTFQYRKCPDPRKTCANLRKSLYVKIGDEVTLIGRDGDEVITMEEVGSLSGRFNYEFVCVLGKRIPRVFYRDGKRIASQEYFDEE